MSGAGRLWVGWALRVAIFLALLAVAAVFQLDRHSSTRMTLMAYVPPGLGGFADAKAARVLAMHAPEMALERAEASLRHRPIDAGTLAAFAMAAVEADDVDRAGRALSYAAGRGWRDTYTQVMVVGSAITEERWVVAAQRIDALSRLQREEEAIFASLSLMLPSEDGRKALAERLSESNPLVYSLADFFGAYPDFGPQVADVFVTARGLQSGMPCASFSRVTRTLLARDHGAQAKSVWPARCLGKDSAKLAFSLGESDENPFAWSYPSAAGLSVRKGEEAGTLTVRNRDRLRRTFATRYVTLPAGSHVLTFEQEVTAAGRPGAMSGPADIHIDLRCDRSSTSKFAALVSQVYVEPVEFAVPADCPTQYLTLSVGSGTATDLSISID